MVATNAETRVEQVAQELFDVVTQLCLVAPRGRRRPNDLKEVEYLTLALLQDRESMNVGDMQRLLGVLPAQMSRIIRSLENRSASLVACRINPRDKRKIDVCLTETGRKAFLDYQSARVHRLVELLRDMNEDDQADVTQSLDKVRGLLERATVS
jgi:DNA-binding MarR family transcriptional regulator